MDILSKIALRFAQNRVGAQHRLHHYYHRLRQPLGTCPSAENTTATADNASRHTTVPRATANYGHITSTTSSVAAAIPPSFASFLWSAVVESLPLVVFVLRICIRLVAPGAWCCKYEGLRATTVRSKKLRPFATSRRARWA